jgi:hypothetical protein
MGNPIVAVKRVGPRLMRTMIGRLGRQAPAQEACDHGPPQAQASDQRRDGCLALEAEQAERAQTADRMKARREWQRHSGLR